MIKKRGRGCERVIVLLIFSLVRIIGMVYSTDITSSHISHTFNFMRDNFKLIDLKKKWRREETKNFTDPHLSMHGVCCKRGRRRGVIQYYVWGLYLGGNIWTLKKWHIMGYLFSLDEILGKNSKTNIKKTLLTFYIL